MQEIDLGVGGMSCQGCVKNVTGVLQALPGVKSVTVSLEAGKAHLVYDESALGLDELKAAVENAGFDAL